MKNQTIKYFIVGLFFCALLFSTTFFLWQQYTCYSCESAHLKNRIEFYRNLYINDSEQLKDRSLQELKNLVSQSKDKLITYSNIFPNNYLIDIINVINIIESISLKNNVDFFLLDLCSNVEDFYEILNVKSKYTGEIGDIKKTLYEINTRFPLLFWESACLKESVPSPNVYSSFKIYLFFETDNKCSAEKSVRSQKTHDYKSNKSCVWLPPFSIKIKNLEEELSQLTGTADENFEISEKWKVLCHYNSLKTLYEKKTEIFDELKKSSTPTKEIIKEIVECNYDSGV